MSFVFNPIYGPVIIGAEITGPSGIAVLRLVLDTGATDTLINIAPLVAIGYDPALSPQRLQVTTGSGIEYAPCISLMKIKALGKEYKELPILCHTLPPSTGVDGLLGLNFFRGLCLKINFRKGEIEIS